jgi:hypothetical protein
MEMIVKSRPRGGTTVSMLGAWMRPAVAGLCILTGAVVMLVALVAVPGTWWAGYVSEAGTAGQPLALPYRCGLIVLALGVVLLALDLGRRGSVAKLRGAAAVLGLAGVLAGTSGAVACSDRCPLPPFEPTTVQDVVHVAASIAGMALLAAAMALIAGSALRRAIRRLAAVAVTLTVPLGAGLGLTMLLAGRGPLAAITERALLFVAVSWLVGTASLLPSRLPLTLLRNSVKVER